jgi:hypothetical protein
MKDEKIISRRYYKSIRAARIAATMLKKHLTDRRVEALYTPRLNKAGRLMRDRKTGLIITSAAVLIIG